MRVCVCVLGVLFCQGARADLLSAQRAYHDGDFDRAAVDYRDLAELGQPLAQYNLAVMYTKGEGLRQSDLNAYAWAMLSAENGYAPGKALAERLRPSLAPGSEQIAEQIRAPFSPANLRAQLMPSIEEEGQADTARCSALQYPKIEYPPEAENRAIQGNVFMEYTVMPDGSGRNPRIIYAVPLKTFDRSARVGLLHTKFRPAPGAKPVHCQIMFHYVAGNQSASDYPRLQAFVHDTQVKAEANDASAQLLYGMMLVGLPQLKTSHKDALPWFLKSAQAGVRDAQYEVGSSLMFGWGCRCEDNKGAEWLRRAAEADQPKAQVRLAEYALRGAPDAARTDIALRWLERATAHGDREGMFYLAALDATSDEFRIRNPQRSLELLDQAHADSIGDPTEFEIRAAAQAQLDHFEDAIRSERRAIDAAGKLAWDLAPLRERLARYEAHQGWSGNLLAL